MDRRNASTHCHSPQNPPLVDHVAGVWAANLFALGQSPGGSNYDDGGDEVSLGQGPIDPGGQGD